MVEMEINNEIRGLQNAIREEQETSERLSGVEERNNREMQYLQQQMTVVRAERERLAGQYSMLRKSLDKAEEESSQFDTAIASTNNELEIMEKNVQRVARQITDVYLQIEGFVSDQTTSKRNEVSTLKNVKRVALDVGRKEEEVVKTRNDIAKLKVEALAVQANRGGLENLLLEVKQDLEQRGKLISQYEAEIKSRHQQIEKKQLYVDRLNREYDEKRRKLEEELGEAVEAAGPLEVKIKSLKKQIAERVAACGVLQKEWLRKQHAIMEQQGAQEKVKAEMAQTKEKRAIVDGKRARIEKVLADEVKEKKDLEIVLRALKMDMDRMNGHTAKYEADATTLKSDTEVLEKGFINKLKTVEQEATAVETQIREIEEARTAIADEVVEAEKQVMLWQRKIHLESEMQKALDPSVGNMETVAMKREIHRIELRLEQLKRRQEQIIVEMERAVHKRSALQLKYEPQAKKAAPKNARRELENLKRSLRTATDGRAQTEDQLAKKESL